jgi:hypothetical protein
MTECCLQYMRWDAERADWCMTGVNPMSLQDIEWAYIVPGILEWSERPLVAPQQAALERAIQRANVGPQACLVPCGADAERVQLVVLVGPLSRPVESVA